MSSNVAHRSLLVVDIESFGAVQRDERIRQELRAKTYAIVREVPQRDRVWEGDTGDGAVFVIDLLLLGAPSSQPVVDCPVPTQLVVLASPSIGDTVETLAEDAYGAAAAEHAIDMDRFLEPMLETVRFEGRDWVVPMHTNAALLYYNTDHVTVLDRARAAHPEADGQDAVTPVMETLGEALRGR